MATLFEVAAQLSFQPRGKAAWLGLFLLFGAFCVWLLGCRWFPSGDGWRFWAGLGLLGLCFVLAWHGWAWLWCYDQLLRGASGCR
jgi:hypothetical protein